VAHWLQGKAVIYIYWKFIQDFFQLDTEEEAVYSLFGRVDERYRIQSVFIHHPKQGWIYLEGHMDPNVIQLLRLTPGIIHKQGDIKRQQLTFRIG